MSTHSFSLFPSPPQPQKSRIPRMKSRSGSVKSEEHIIAALTKPPTAAMVASTTTKGKSLDGEGEITVHATTVIRVDSPVGKEKRNDDLSKSRRKSFRKVAKIVYPMVPKRTSTPGEAGLRSATTSPSMEKVQAHEISVAHSPRFEPTQNIEKSPRVNQRQDWGVNQIPTPLSSPGNVISANLPSPPPIPDSRFQSINGSSSSPSSYTPKSATTGTPSTYNASPSTAPTSVYTSPRVSLHNKFTPPIPEGSIHRSTSPPASPPIMGMLRPESPPTNKRSPSPALWIRTEMNRIPSPPPTTPPPQPINSIFPVYNPQIPLQKQNYVPAYNPHSNMTTSPPRHHFSRDYSPNAGTTSPPMLQSPPPTQTSFGESKDPDTIGLALSPTDGDVCGPLGGFVRYEGAGGGITAMPKENMQRGCGPVFPAPPKQDFDGTRGEKKRRKRYEEERAQAREEARLETIRAQTSHPSLNSDGHSSRRVDVSRKPSRLKRFFAILLRGRW